MFWFFLQQGSLWPWSYGSWIYKYMCNQCLSPLTLWVQISYMARCAQYNIMWLSLSVTCASSVVFFGYSGILRHYNWPPQYNWNIVKSGVKQHNSNHDPSSFNMIWTHTVCTLHNNDQHYIFQTQDETEFSWIKINSRIYQYAADCLFYTMM